jgi:hypothetical protein
VIVAYAGRRPSGQDGAFPDHNEPFVRERLERLMAGLRPRLAVGSCAAGGDLLTAAAAADAGAELRLVVAGDLDEFRRVSVADKGDEWEARLAGLLRRPALEFTALRVLADDAGFAWVNGAILDYAIDSLVPGEELVVVGVSAGRRTGLDHTADLVDAARGAGHLGLCLDPSIGRPAAPVAFVAMPYGVRKSGVPGRPDYDADASWHRIVVPALIDAGYRPVRVDIDPSTEIIDAKMIRAIGEADLLIADLAQHNPNVFWELGIRHAWVPSGTILIAPTHGPRAPFDVNHLTVHEYDRDDERVTDVQSVRAIRQLQRVLSGVSLTRVDSPAFAALPDLRRQHFAQARDEDVYPAVVAASEQISLHADLHRTAELLDLADSIDTLDVPAPTKSALRERVGFALLDLDHPDDALAILRPLAEADGKFDRVTLQQNLALALMRAHEPAGELEQRLLHAEWLLSHLDRVHPGSGETLGLLGSAAKRMFRRTAGTRARGHLDRAVSAYVGGFTADPTDYYPGVNAVALLRLRSRIIGSSADEAQARALLPVVRFMAQRSPATPWRRATEAELLLHEHQLGGAIQREEIANAYAVAAAATSPSARSSMIDQLVLCKDHGDPADLIDQIVALF